MSWSEKNYHFSKATPTHGWNDLLTALSAKGVEVYISGSFACSVQSEWHICSYMYILSFLGWLQSSYHKAQSHNFILHKLFWVGGFTMYFPSVNEIISRDANLETKWGESFFFGVSNNIISQVPWKLALISPRSLLQHCQLWVRMHLGWHLATHRLIVGTFISWKIRASVWTCWQSRLHAPNMLLGPHPH